MNQPSIEKVVLHLPEKEREQALQIAAGLPDDERNAFAAKLARLDSQADTEQQASMDGMKNLVQDAEHAIHVDHRQVEHQKEEREHGEDEERATSILDSMQ